MMTKLVKLAEKNGLYRVIICCACWFVLKILSALWEAGSFLRRIGLAFPKHKKNKDIKDIHNGERCFILCTGPSLRLEDLELLKDEYTFAMNSLLLLYDKTSFRPTYYGVIDERVFLKLQDLIIKYSADGKGVFVSQRCTKHGVMMDNWYEIPVNVAYHTYDRWFKRKFWARFSDDAYSGLYDMYSVTHFLIQIAVYMGFKEIYLLGADCNQRIGKQVHFAEYGVGDASLDTARERNICGYKEIKRYCDSHDVNVYNATRGGELEVFERVNIEELTGHK